MNELTYQMREAEDAAWQQELEERRKRSGGTDYQWLFSRQPKRRDLTQSEDFELAQLCSQVRPHETMEIIQMFRDAMLRSPKVDEIPRIFRACVSHVLDRKQPSESLPQMMKRSIAKLHPGVRILPIGDDCDNVNPSGSFTRITFVNNAFNGRAPNSSANGNQLV